MPGTFNRLRLPSLRTGASPLTIIIFVLLVVGVIIFAMLPSFRTKAPVFPVPQDVTRVADPVTPGMS
jgi:hypothetical protein